VAEDDQRNIECLHNAINETQETVRSYDTKSEILGILMTLVVGLLNFNLVGDYKRDTVVMLLIALATISAITSLLLMLSVLFPSRNPVEEVDLGEYTPKGTYFVFKKRGDKFNFNAIYSNMIDTDWQKELLLELLKVSGIRDRKHTWFTRAVKTAAFTFIVIMLLVIRMGCLCTTK